MGVASGAIGPYTVEIENEACVELYKRGQDQFGVFKSRIRINAPFSRRRASPGLGAPMGSSRSF